jgi:hypothetical protein
MHPNQPRRGPAPRAGPTGPGAVSPAAPVWGARERGERRPGRSDGRASFGRTAAVVIVFAVAMAYLESAVVVYLSGALGARVGDIFPLRPAVEAGTLVAIEVGREAATLVMIAAVGWLVGRTGLERLAWSAVVFGAWDIGYYGWLVVFAGWPASPATTDLLFLLPVPWVGPFWSPVVVSMALMGFGLLAARRLGAGGRVALRPWHVAGGVGGGLLCILSWTLDSAVVAAGGLPGVYPWPIFVAGMGAALIAALDALGLAPRPPRRRPVSTA